VIKQVIVVRKDLDMPVGKIAAQVAHASMGVFFNIMTPIFDLGNDCESNSFELPMTDAMIEWKNGIFTKICLACNSEEELLDISEAAKEANLPFCLIKDNGLTCFNGIHTYTCVAIGPDYNEKIDKITGKLKLLK